MAREAGNVHLAIRELRVDLLGHLDHMARNFLLGLFVAGKVALNVTVDALHAQPGCEGAHDLSYFRAGGDLQDFKIGGVGNLLRRFFLLVLGAERQQNKAADAYETHANMIHRFDQDSAMPSDAVPLLPDYWQRVQPDGLHSDRSVGPLRDHDGSESAFRKVRC